MLMDDLRGLFYIALKDLKAYYFKPPNISWGILFPFTFILAFAIRNPGDLRALVPGLLALTVLFGTSSMEALSGALARWNGCCLPPSDCRLYWRENCSAAWSLV